MPLGFQLALAFALGGVVGVLIGWLISRGRAAPADARLENELRQQLVQREAELNQTRAEAKATGYMIDVHSGRVVAVSSAQTQGGQLTPAISTDAERVVFLRKLRGEVTAKLADQVVADCKGKTAATASAQ